MTSPQLPNELVDILQHSFTRPKASSVNELALDLTALALRLRTGCLLDKLTLDQPRARQLGRSLHQLGGQWGDLTVIHEPLSQQSLIINAALLRRRLDQADWPAFVEVANPVPTVLKRPPPRLRERLDIIAATTDDPGFHLLRLGVDPDDGGALARAMVPLVGYLLDYSVAYTLDGITTEGIGSHLLLAFSVPTELLAPAGPLPFSALQLHDSLVSEFGARLKAARAGAPGVGAWDGVEVAVRGGVVHDRFAL